MPGQSTQVTFPENFNAKMLIFDPIQKRNLPSDNGEEGASYYTTPIRMRYSDGTEGPVIFQLPRCPTFGINRGYNKEETPNKISLSIVLGERDNYSDDHKTCVRALNDFVLACKNHIVGSDEIKAAIGQEDLELRDLTGGKKEISPIRPAKDKETNKPVSMDLRPPTMYAKMMLGTDKVTKGKIISSKFYEEGKVDNRGNPVEVNPYDFMDKQGWCTPVLKFESIYFGTKIKIQCKVYECDMKVKDNSFVSLIHRSNKRVVANDDDEPSLPDDVSYDQYGDDEEPVAAPQILNEDDDQEMATAEQEEEEERPPTPPPVVVAPAKAPVRRGAAKK